MQVHDELVFDVDEDRVEEVAGLAVDRMVAAYDLRPPLEVEAKVGELWGRVSHCRPIAGPVFAGRIAV